MPKPKHLEYFSHADVLRQLKDMQDKSGPAVAGIPTRGTRRDLARILAVHETYVSQIFKGDKEFTNRILASLDPPLQRQVVYIKVRSSRRKVSKNGKP